MLIFIHIILTVTLLRITLGTMPIAPFSHQANYHEPQSKEVATFGNLFQNRQQSKDALRISTAEAILNTNDINNIQRLNEYDRNKPTIDKNIMARLINKTNQSVPSSFLSNLTQHRILSLLSSMASSFKRVVTNPRWHNMRRRCLYFLQHPRGGKVHDSLNPCFGFDTIHESKTYLILCHCIVVGNSLKGFDFHTSYKMRSSQKAYCEEINQLYKLHQVEFSKLFDSIACVDILRRLCSMCGSQTGKPLGWHRNKRDTRVQELTKVFQHLLPTGGDVLADGNYSSQTNTSKDRSSLSHVAVRSSTESHICEKLLRLEKLVLFIGTFHQGNLQKPKISSKDNKVTNQPQADNPGLRISQNVERLLQLGEIVEKDVKHLLAMIFNETNNICQSFKNVTGSARPELEPSKQKPTADIEREDSSRYIPSSAHPLWHLLNNSIFNNSLQNIMISKIQSSDKAIDDISNPHPGSFPKVMSREVDAVNLSSFSSPANKRNLMSETRHRQHSATETCQTRLTTRLVALPGCVPKSLTITYCMGTCNSRSVPQWDVQQQEVNNIKHCTCCAPNSLKFRDIVFVCPRRRNGVLVKRVGYPFQCVCRPCSVTPQVEAEQPYDY